MSKKEKAEKNTNNQQSTTQQEETQSTQQTSQETQSNCDSQSEESKEGDKTAGQDAQVAKEWQDKYARLSAEFDNFRKRTLKEKMDLVENGGAEVLKLMLQTADDFDRALQHISDEEVKSGVELIYNKFLGSLRSKGVEVMDLKGKTFDVDFAEAIAKFPAPSPEQSGTIMDVAEKGYMLKEKVLRFAKVVVFE